MSILTPLRHRRPRRGVPRYLRPAPSQVLGLSPAAWSTVITLLIFFAIEMYARFVVAGSLNLVPVTAMVSGAAELLTSLDFLGGDLGRSLLAILVGFVTAAMSGPIVAYLMWRSGWFERALRPYLDVFYAVPIFALYPILVVLFGTGLVPIVGLAWCFGTVVAISHALVGFQSVPITVDKLSRSLQLNRTQYVRRILVPAALPDIMAGLKLCLAYVIIVVLATEFILSPAGIGHFISQAYNSFATEQMYAAVLLVGVLALLVNIGMGALFDRLDWRQR